MPLRTTRRWLQARGGEAPFRDFMAAALHDPESGYYGRNVKTVGRRGDFSTAATLGDVPGRAIANWLRSEAALHGRPLRKWTLIEAGPGDGSLHAAVLRSLRWWQRPQKSLLVESSSALREVQQQKLRGGRFTWRPDMNSALQACDGAALIFSNELVDAFPVTLLERTAAGWAEVCLALDGESVTEVLRVPAGPPQSAATEAAPLFAPGQRIEVHESFRAWLEQWTPALRAGSILTIDYGDLFPQVYHRRPRGTLRGYLLHQRMEGAELLQNMGRMDLTADVNFTDLIRWGEQCGLAAAGCGTQAEFFKAHVPLAGLGAADARLCDPEGPGGAFRCLVQRRLAGSGGAA